MECVRSGRVLVMMAVACRLLAPGAAASQTTPRLRAGVNRGAIVVDGVLDEPAWRDAESIDAFSQTEPREGMMATANTTVRVLADTKTLVIGVVCDTATPDEIVSFNVRRDAPLGQEDNVRVVLGTFLDGRSGYIFAVNPNGARYDALVEPGGIENGDWDGVWEATSVRTATGWTTEIAIPVQSVSFKPGLTEWHFNVERRQQRRLETDRWASPVRQYQLNQTSRAGLLTDLPDFSVGLGLTVRPSLTSGAGLASPSAGVDSHLEPSLDVTQRLGANVLASATVRTDFAETEVDTRRTNLTRFPLFFPEKRTFFLEGTDIFAFGLGLGQDVIPFFSRRIGLVGGTEVPIVAGGKVNGRVGRSNAGGLVVGTSPQAGVVDDAALMGVSRVKQNLWSESGIGAIVSVGDPLGRPGSWLAGVDFTYATSQFRGNKNFRVGGWALATGRDGLGRDATAHGITVQYPNDLWDLNLVYKRIGRDFDPSLGFVPRRAVHLLNGQFNNRTRIASGPWQQLTHEFQPFVAFDLTGKWESYRFFTAPVNWRFRSGERLEVNVNPTGEQLAAPFEVAPDVRIAPGAYRWTRYRLEAGTAQKRRLYTQVTWWLGGFYDGHLDQLIWSSTWNPTPLVTVEFTGERNTGRVHAGPITQTVVGTRVRLNVSPNLSVASYTQYDTNSDSIGVNTRLRWTFTPLGDLFVVYNHNVRSLLDRWAFDSNQLLAKFQYSWRL